MIVILLLEYDVMLAGQLALLMVMVYSSSQWYNNRGNIVVLPVDAINKL